MMVCWRRKFAQSDGKSPVLILILVDDGLLEKAKHTKRLNLYVLILILVDDGLLEFTDFLFGGAKAIVLILILVDDGLLVLPTLGRTRHLAVLILILVDDGLLEDILRSRNDLFKCLNPYSGG